MDMTRQLMSESMTIRIVGDNGDVTFPLIEKDDLMGLFDYRAKVLPSIAGMQDVNKKQAMDLFQLVSQVDPQASGVDIKKMLAKLLSEWDWSLDSISSSGEDTPDPAAGMTPEMMAAMGGDPAAGGAPTDPMAGAMPGGMPGGMPGAMPPPMGADEEAMSRVLSLLRSPEELTPNAGAPVDLLQTEGPPPTPPSAPTGMGGPGPARSWMKGANPSGHNRTGKVNTNISKGNNASVESSILNRTFNIQR